MKTLDVEKCFFLPKIERIHINFVDYDPLRMNKADEIVFYYTYDKKTHNLYIDQLNSKYGTPSRKDEDHYEWKDDIFYINIIKHKPFLNNNTINIVNINFTTYEYKRLFEDRYNYINSNYLN
ncbi:hypothetical protein [Anaerobiospirillum thomasii]|uniref:Uncharacterized protein n=1 Tax=Anaerobiospirillum thomasii TaxID=179995 RepID=A0A2X0V7F3_9GAMM|nr:hypothetical protein [Anaerobiospirillum thomasii]SPT70384.1 Uncharacterised protein [Anaerobiospirillum thomasii]